MRESDSVLNEVEKKNVQFLEMAEEELEPGGYKLISRRMKCTEKCTEV